jgi:hypothetical protein
VEAEALTSGLRQGQMAAVDGIEGAAEQGNIHAGLGRRLSPVASVAANP